MDLSLTAYHNQVFIGENEIGGSRKDKTDLTTTGVSLLNRSDLGQLGPLGQLFTYGVDFYHDEAQAESGKGGPLTRPPHTT